MSSQGEKRLGSTDCSRVGNIANNPGSIISLSDWLFNWQ